MRKPKTIANRGFNTHLSRNGRAKPITQARVDRLNNLPYGSLTNKIFIHDLNIADRSQSVKSKFVDSRSASFSASSWLSLGTSLR